ncbi:MAG: hypothetical protein LBL47_02930 [Lactobacillus sp.]|nr:hypothetical protein [Lactobacillus sp.]
MTINSAADFFSTITHNIGILTSSFGDMFAELSNVKVASVILILLALILFLFLIIVLYVKSIVSFIRSDPKTYTDKPAERSVSFFDEADEDEIAREMEREEENEKEQERMDAEKIYLEQQEKLRIETIKREEEQEKEEKERKKNKKDLIVDLDWKKGKLKDLGASSIALHASALEYKQSEKNLSELIGLLIDMLSRGVDELKIAQTLMYRNHGQTSEDDILQLIETIKEFIKLCNGRKFEKVNNAEKLPDNEKALIALVNGDPAPTMLLLQAVIDYNVEKSASTTGVKREALFKEASVWALAFGSLASIEDMALAANAFELAIELNPQNINAWNKVADAYYKMEKHDKAIWAYENLIQMANEETNQRQLANASKMLSQYYYEKGENLSASKLYNRSKEYYDRIGINRRLDRKELEIIDIIESKHKENMGSIVANVLSGNENAI